MSALTTWETKVLLFITIVFYVAMVWNAQIGWDGLCPPNMDRVPTDSWLVPRNVCHWPWEGSQP